MSKSGWTAESVLKLIAENGAAMGALAGPSCYIEPHRPPKVYPANTTIGGVPLGGTLVLDEATGAPVDEGAPARSLADLVREVVGA